MPKVVFIGAGSFGFTRNLVRDLLTYKSLRSSEIALVDINRRRLDFARRACQKLIDQGGVRRHRYSDHRTSRGFAKS